jgi:hypothetical protein
VLLPIDEKKILKPDYLLVETMSKADASVVEPLVSALMLQPLFLEYPRRSVSMERLVFSETSLFVPHANPMVRSVCWHQVA